jgi:hypothetical protein
MKKNEFNIGFDGKTPNKNKKKAKGKENIGTTKL